ncbi:MAG: HpcH/HpaI aldolase/citrate lyase family protein [Dysosmobacter sp.]|nr:HpcH/HpaI aldolase/citrate lyase family protein [Dysosmobacter sp.]
MSRKVNGYDVGALLYCPANAHSGIVDALKNERYPRPFSLAFCLEDTVREDAVEAAEQELYRTLERIDAARKEREFYLPLIFIRIRSPRQLRRLASAFYGFSEILTGFILPKFFVENCGEYIKTVQDVRADTGSDYYYMPIFESASMIDLCRRYSDLAQVKERLEEISDQILNIRVGGNDLSHAFGLRRHVNNTIYELRPVADLLTDIVTTFAGRYVVSGPVWEYYAGSGWESGLQKEIEMDLLCGFIGKTVIHPNQIPVVNECLKVSPADYQDACRILNWDPASPRLVLSSAESTRMNEYNTHFHWADRIIQLARVYGIKAEPA